jgi:hypothetical protein
MYTLPQVLPSISALSGSSSRCLIPQTHVKAPGPGHTSCNASDLYLNIDPAPELTYARNICPSAVLPIMENDPCRDQHTDSRRRADSIDPFGLFVRI